MNLSTKVRFAFNAMNAVKKAFKQVNFVHRLSSERQFSPLPTECGKANFHRYWQNAVKKISPWKSQVFQIFSALISPLLFFHRKYHWRKWEIAQCKKKFLTWRRWEVRTCVRQYLSCKKSIECGEKRFFTAENPQKFAAFSAIRCRPFAVKIFFHRSSPLILH